MGRAEILQEAKAARVGRARAELLLDQAEVVGKARVGPRRAGAEAVLFLLDRLLLGLVVTFLDRLLLGLAVVLLDRLLGLVVVVLMGRLLDLAVLDLVALGVVALEGILEVLGLGPLILMRLSTPLSVLQGMGPTPHSGGAACS